MLMFLSRRVPRSNPSEDTLIIIHYLGSEYFANIPSNYNIIFGKFILGILRKIVNSNIGWILRSIRKNSQIIKCVDKRISPANIQVTLPSNICQIFSFNIRWMSFLFYSDHCSRMFTGCVKQIIQNLLKTNIR